MLSYDGAIPSNLLCSRGDAAVAAFTAAGEPAAPGPDTQPDCQERPAAGAQHRAGRAFPSSRPFLADLLPLVCAYQLSVVKSRWDSRRN